MGLAGGLTHPYDYCQFTMRFSMLGMAMMYGISLTKLILIGVTFVLPASVVGLAVWLVLRKTPRPPLVTCPQCGAPTGLNANYCAHCGRRL